MRFLTCTTRRGLWTLNQAIAVTMLLVHSVTRSCIALISFDAAAASNRSWPSVSACGARPPVKGAAALHSQVPQPTRRSRQFGLIGKAAKQRALRLEDMGIVSLATLDDEPDWDAIEDGDPRYELAIPPSTNGDEA